VTTAAALAEAVRSAWASIPAPPADDLASMSWGWGEKAARAFTGVAPMDVDIASEGFFAATPLLDLPPRAGAAYLGTFVLALLRSLELQDSIGIFFDAETRAHTITCLTRPSFWERAIRPYLPAPCRDVLKQVASFLAAKREALALTAVDVDDLLRLAAEGPLGSA
jgi:hypothetical protein